MFPVHFFLIIIVFELVYSFIPSSELSTPIPDSLCPPNGAFGESTCASLIHTVPVSSLSAMDLANSDLSPKWNRQVHNWYYSRDQ